MKSGYHHGDLRTALVEAGLARLAEQAADELSLREMARSVGVSATAVYRHFPDKAAFMAALAREGLDRLAAAQHAAFDAAGGGAPGFAATGRAYVRFALENPALFRLVFSSPRTVEFLAGKDDEAMAFLMANAADASAAWRGGSARTRAVQAWSLAHGLAMLMLDGQIPRDERLIEETMSGGAPLPGSSA